MGKDEKQLMIEKILELREENKRLIRQLNGEETMSVAQSLEIAEAKKDAELKALLYTNLDSSTEKNRFFIENKEELGTLGKNYTSFQAEVFDEFRVGSILQTCVYVVEITAIKYADKSAYFLIVSDPYKTYTILQTDEFDANYKQYLGKHCIIEYIKNKEHIPEDEKDYATMFISLLNIKVYA